VRLLHRERVVEAQVAVAAKVVLLTAAVVAAVVEAVKVATLEIMFEEKVRPH